MGLILTSEAMRVVERNDRGNVTYRKRYKRGDEVDTSHMEDDHVQRLVDSGALVDSADAEVALSDDEGAAQARVAAVNTGPFGASTSGPGDDLSHEDIQDDAEPDKADDAEFDPDNPEPVDEYTPMDYSELQQAAKAKGLNAGGSAEDLRARLRETPSE